MTEKRTPEEEKRRVEQEEIYDRHRAKVRAAGFEIPKDARVFDYDVVESFPLVVVRMEMVHDRGPRLIGYYVDGKFHDDPDVAGPALSTRGWGSADLGTRARFALDWATDVLIRNAAFRSNAEKPPTATSGNDGSVTITGQMEISRRSGPWGQNDEGTATQPVMLVFSQDGHVKGNPNARED